MTPIRVLVVDDSVVVRRLVSGRPVPGPGVDVVGIAANGRLALGQGRAARPRPRHDGHRDARDGRHRGGAAPAARRPHACRSSCSPRSPSGVRRRRSTPSPPARQDYVTKPGQRRQRPGVARPGRRQPAAARSRRSCRARRARGTRSRATGTTAARRRASATGPRPPRSARRRAPRARRRTRSARSSSARRPVARRRCPGWSARSRPRRASRSSWSSTCRRSSRGSSPRASTASARPRVVEAEPGMELRPGTVYIAPGDHHLEVQRQRRRAARVLTDGPPVNFCRPSVDVLFRSAVRAFGGELLAVVLTGMGADGRDRLPATSSTPAAPSLVQDERDERRVGHARRRRDRRSRPPRRCRSRGGPDDRAPSRAADRSGSRTRRGVLMACQRGVVRLRRGPGPSPQRASSSRPARSTSSRAGCCRSRARHGLPDVDAYVAAVRAQRPEESDVRARRRGADHQRDVLVPRLRAVRGAAVVRRARAPGGARSRHAALQVWSAACSTGQEPYSIAMTLADCLPPDAARGRSSRTDLSEQVLAKARDGPVQPARGQPWPARRDARAGTSTPHGRRVADLARSCAAIVTFRAHNLLDAPPTGGPFDVVFLRNVLIYFDLATKRAILERLRRVMRPGRRPLPRRGRDHDRGRRRLGARPRRDRLRLPTRPGRCPRPPDRHRAPRPEPPPVQLCPS